MIVRVGVCAALALLLAGATLPAQTRPVIGGPQALRQSSPQQPNRSAERRYPPVSYPPAPGPTQPIVPRDPRLQRRPPATQQLPPPFHLTPQQEAELDQVLQAWERRSAGVKTFDCKFSRWEYDPVFGPARTHRYQDAGQIKYKAPDCGMFCVTYTEKGGQMVAIEDERKEHWICDGKSIYEFNYLQRQVVEHPLPPELQGRAIMDGPLPFLFGAEVARLKYRYYLRIVPPGAQGQIRLDAYPRFQKDAANFRRAVLILTTPDMLPYAMEVHAPNGKNRTAYQFYDIVINDRDPLRFLKGNPFHPVTPLRWKRVKESRTAQVAPQQAGAERR